MRSARERVFSTSAGVTQALRACEMPHARCSNSDVRCVREIRTWINRSVPLFLSGLAVSVGFRMNLFNIGVEGQYSVAAVVAAAAGAMVHLPRRCTSRSSCWSPWRPARPTRRCRPS